MVLPQSGSDEANIGFVEPPQEQCCEQVFTAEDIASLLPKSNDAPLGEFFARPLKIFATTWSASAPVTFSIQPWYLFFNSPRVANRMTNFKLLKCNLKIKIVCNGNSFYMGRAMVSWNPYSADDNYFRYDDADAAVVFAHSVRLSQRQHVMLDPSQSTGGEIICPFLWQNDFIDVPRMPTDTAQIGTLNCQTLVPLSLITEPVAGSVNPVAITIYAWAENVEVGGLTVEDMSLLTPQSGSSEYGGKVSSIASSIAVAASRWVKAPFIAPYALATAMAANTVADIAKLFGFSKPCIVEDPLRIRPTNIASLATCIGNDGSNKLTVDPKQEVSVDPRLMGLNGEDQMDIVSIASRNSLVAKFDWDFTDVYGTLLYTSLVDPCINHRVSDADGRIFMPACCGVTLPFKYWSGTLEFTFEVVATAYHRGRIAIVYDPHRTPLALESNVNYNYIVDISEARKFSIKIGNTQTQCLRKHFEPYTSGQFFSVFCRGGHGPVGITPTQISSAGGIGNGLLSVFVINDLTASNTTTAGAKILMYVRACEDFRVYSPNADLYKYQYLLPQSGIEPISTVTTVAEHPTFHVEVRNSDPGLSKIFIGENILSIRTILKRYVHYLSHYVPMTVSTNLIYFEHAIYPLMYMNAVDTIHTSAALVPINYVGHSYISYYRPAFAAIRGGTRWKVVPTKAPNVAGGISTLSVTLMDDAITNLPVEQLVTQSPDGTPYSHLVANRYTHEGEVLSVASTNPTLEFEVPFYTAYRFVIGSSSDDTKFATIAPGFRVLGSFNSIGSVCSLYVAAAEDLSMHYFHGFPIMICNSDVIPLPT